MSITTHHGHRVHVIEGDAVGIQERGAEIEDLGRQMVGAAGILQEIGDGASEERGRSIERIRDEVGDVHEELAKAGERYRPTGTAMKKYGSELERIQTAMRSIVRDADEANAVLQARQSESISSASTAASVGVPDPTDPVAVKTAAQLATAASEAAQLATAAERTLTTHLDAFDVQWDAWDLAYDAALSSIEDATQGNVTDDWTDNLAGVVEIVLKVLTWVGVALAIAALIIGGPFIAAIAAVVAVIALIGTVFLYFKGRRDGGDVAWAVVGVLPFGKLGKVFQKGKRLEGVTDFLKGPITNITTPVRNMRDLRGLVSNPQMFSGAGKGLGRRAAEGLATRLGTDFSSFSGRFGGIQGIKTRILGGASRTYSETLASNFASMSSHHRSLISPHLGSLEKVIAGGGSSLGVAEQVINGASFAVSRTRQVMGRANDISSLFAADPIDSWREQLA